jgi:hypothetical protein
MITKENLTILIWIVKITHIDYNHNERYIALSLS